MKDFLYQQIYQKIIDDIKSKKIKAGEKLPSIRKYADENGLSCNTVQSAYNQLLSEGYIISKEKRGYFICDFSMDEEVFRSKGTETNVRSKGTETNVKNNSLYKSVQKSVKIEDKDVINLSANLIDSSIFPYNTLRHLYRECLSGKNQQIFQQTGDFCGDWEFRNAICSFIYKHRGIKCNPQQIIVGGGTAYLFLQLIKLFTEENEQPSFLMENPCYTKTEQIILDSDCLTYPLPLDSEGIDINAFYSMPNCFNSKANLLLHITPSHQFPTGITMSAPRKAAILKWAYEAKNRFVIEDDYDSDFRYKGRPIPSIQSMDNRDRVIYMGTFSRTLTPSLRISYMVLPPALLQQYEKKFSYYTCSVSRIDQQVLSVFLNEGYFERHINRAKKIYRERRNLMLETLQNYFCNINIMGQEAGLHFIVKVDSLKKGLEEQKLIEAAKNHKLLITGTGTGWIIIGYAHLKEQDIKKVVVVLNETITAL